MTARVRGWMSRSTRIPAAVVCAACFTLAGLLPTPAGAARALTFEERIAAQEAIERVYYSHQLAATRPFAAAVPRSLLERKVRRYLQESAALEVEWRTPITAEMLRAELERIVRSTRFPDRLAEIFDRLHRDPLLIQECLIRPLLAHRLTRSFLASDERIQGQARRQAEVLRAGLIDGTVSPASPQPFRTVVEFTVREGDSSSPPGSASFDGLMRIAVDREELARLRAELPAVAGAIGPMEEGRDAIGVRVVLDESEDFLSVAAFSVRKVSWEEWWRREERRFDPESVATVASERPVMPTGAGRASGVEDTVPFPGASSEAEVREECVLQDRWDDVSLDDFVDSRGNHVAVWTGTLMVVWGGQGGRIFADGGRYDPLTDTWSTMSSLGAPDARWGATAVWTGRQMVVWGGYGIVNYLNSGGRYDPATDEWAPTSLVNAPAPRYEHTAVWTGVLMIVWGGRTFTASNTGGRYDPESDSWLPTTQVNAPYDRLQHAAVWTGAEMIIWGAETGGGRYDPTRDRWSAVSVVGAPGSGRGLSAVWTGSEMIAWGGGGPNNTGGRYNPLTDTWRPTSTTLAPWGRAYHKAVWTGDRMIVWGGGYGSGDRSGGVYDPVTDRWTPTSVVNAPSAAFGHTAVWTGSLMIVWGGGTIPGGRYDPATDSWTPVAPTEPIEGRYNQATVWTGNLMVVWGGLGRGYTAWLDTGGRYDPLLDAWTETSLTGALPPTPSPVAVWTGAEMISWGGEQGQSPYVRDTGARYDPVADLWTPISRLGAPAPRSGHTLVWTGARMIVWGSAESGGIYDPSSDTWASMSTVGQPLGRWGHTAVWSGREMLVWGSTSPYTNPGARYDPNLDAWLPISMVGAPEGRHWHSAVWTGSEMIVWGGGNHICCQKTGGRYNPITDTWALTATDGAPSGREAHSAVWTGRLMVVWGGSYSSVYPAGTGGVYEPRADRWTPTATLAGPLGRTGHSAVWADDAMIIWGGNGLASGGRYDLGPMVDEDDDDFSVCEGDCDDGDPGIGPSAIDVCDGLDNDCDGRADEDVDADGDLTGDCLDNCPFTFNPRQEDVDSDAFGDACDNCPVLHNASQMDGDDDGVGTICDDCPQVPDADQVDRDADAVGDACDNCTGDFNPGQGDGDRDRIGDLCDPAFDRGVLLLSPESATAAAGTRLPFHLRLANNGSAPASGFLVLSSLPSGGSETLLPGALVCGGENPLPLSLGSGRLVERDCHLDVPATAPPGSYELIARARTAANVILEDRISLTVIAP